MSVPEVAALHDAAGRGDVSAVQGLLKDGVDANSRAHTFRCRDPSGCSALHVAVRKGHFEVALTLLEAGADPNGLQGGRDSGDEYESDPYPLHEAAMSGNSDLTQALLDAGAETDPIANVEAVETLYDIEAEGCGTPLCYAAELGNIEVVRILVEAGADVSTSVNLLDRTPLHRAACNGHGSIVEILVDAGAAVDAQDKGEFTPLHDARSLAVVEALLAAGADPNVVCEGLDLDIRCTPIGMYCLTRRMDEVVAMVDALLCHGVDTSIPVYVRGGPVGSLVSCAVQGGKPDLVSRLLDAGLDPNDADLEPNEDVYDGMLPIHIAAICGDEKVVRVLLQRGADKEARTEKIGSTPLHLACRWANLECVQEFLRWNVSLTQRDSRTGDSGSLAEDVVGREYFVRGCRSGAAFRRRRVPGASDAENLVHEANNRDAVRRVLRAAAAWRRRGPVILLRACLVKQLAKPIAPVKRFTKARAYSTGIEDSGGSGGDLTFTADTGCDAGGSRTIRNLEVGVGDGCIVVTQTHEAGYARNKGALCDVLERLVALGNEEDGVFRHVTMFL